MSSLGDCLLAKAIMFNQAEGERSDIITSGKSCDTHTNDSPHTILLTDVVRAGTEGLLTTDGKLSGIHEVTEEFPAWEYN